MREMLVGTCDAQGEGGQTRRPKYYVLIGEMEVSGGFACESYGVKIMDADDPGEAVSVPNITTSVSRIDELMELLTRNSVTPEGLGDILSDWL